MVLVASSQPNKDLKFISSKLYYIRAQRPALRFYSLKSWPFTTPEYGINWPGPASTCMARQANDSWLGPELCYGPIMAAMDHKISESEPCRLLSVEVLHYRHVKISSN